MTHLLLALLTLLSFAGSSIAGTVISIEGDSHSDTQGSGYEWHVQIQRICPLFQNATITEFATSGERAGQMVAQHATEAGAVSLEGHKGYYLLLAGSNDITGTADTAATIYGYLTSLWSAARTSGYRVYAMTLFIRPAFTTAQATKQDQLNALILSDPSLYDGIVRLDRVINTSHISGDNIHLNSSGAAAFARTVSSAIGYPVFPISSDPDVADWVRRARLAGGTASDTTITALNNFVTSCKASGVWGSLKRVNLICGDNLAAARTPLKCGNGYALDRAINLVETDYTEATGITGNGTSKYLNTGFNPVSESLTSSHLLHYSTQLASGAASKVIIGASTTSPAAQMFMWWNASSVSEFGGLGSATTSDNIYFGGNARLSGFCLITTTGTTRGMQAYRNGVFIGSGITAAGVMPNAQIYLLANNGNGAASNFDTRSLRGYSIGSFISFTAQSAYYTAMQAFQTALGRQL